MQDVIIDTVWIDDPGAFQNDAGLGGYCAFTGGKPGDPAGKLCNGGLQPGNDSPFVKVLFHDLMDILDLNRSIGDCFRVHDDQRADVMAANIRDHREVYFIL